MFAKIIAVVAVVASVASAEPCGYLSTGLSGIYGSRVLTTGCSANVVSSIPACSPVAVPTQVVDPIAPVVSAGVVAPVVSTGIVAPTVSTGIVAPVVSTGVVAPVVSSGIVGTGIYGSGCYGGYGYGATLAGCGAGVLTSVC